MNITELLITVAIIAVVIALAFAAHSDALQMARIQETRSILSVVDSALHERRASLGQAHMLHASVEFKASYDAAGNDPPTMPMALAEIIVRKNTFRGALPQRLEDTWGFDGIPGTTDDSRVWSLWKDATGATDATPRPPEHDIATESSELLVIALSGSLSLHHSHATLVVDTDGDGTKEIRDSWGNPVRFYNWPTRLVRPLGEHAGILVDDNNPYHAGKFLGGTPAVASIAVWDYRHPLNSDPDDPTGIIGLYLDGEDINGNGVLDTDDLDGDGVDELSEDMNSNGSLDRGEFANLRYGYMLTAGAVPAVPLSEEFFHTLNTYHVPLLISAGPDGRLGLHEPTHNGPERLAQPVNLDELLDNVIAR